MNREIKFRYWNGVVKQMVYEPKIRAGYQFSLNEYINEERGWNWMQYTGLKDKNGVEIYEGDLLSYLGNEPKEVIFHKGVFCHKVGEKEYHIFGEKDWEIIGNIYENPDLIK